MNFVIFYNPDCGTLFKDKPVISFRWLPNLRDILTNTSVTYPQVDSGKIDPKPTICIRLGKCTYCPLINIINTVKCNFTHKSDPTKDLPKHITCELNNIIYLISCKKCHKHYVGETSRAFKCVSTKSHYIKMEKSHQCEYVLMKYFTAVVCVCCV